MVQLTHELKLLLNLFYITAVMFAIFAISGYILEKLENKERRQRNRYKRRRKKLNCYEMQRSFNEICNSLEEANNKMDVPDLKSNRSDKLDISAADERVKYSDDSHYG